jgi:enoyl-CoA hydratase/carnithine racemase
MTDYVRIERDGPLATLVLSDPATRNAMTPPMTAAFAAAIAELRADRDVRALIVTGDGGAFSSGGDLAMLERMHEQPPEQNRREMGQFYRTYLGVLSLDVPSIAAINGAAIGAGLAFTLGCDVRIAATTAKLGFTFLNLGLYPGMGTIHLLPCVTGEARAAELVLTGRVISANEALAAGLVTHVAEPDGLLERAREIAGAIASKPQLAVRMARRALARTKLDGLEAALDSDAVAQMTSYASVEMRDALARLRART